jgi:hypothetical protein
MSGVAIIAAVVVAEGNHRAARSTVDGRWSTERIMSPA